MNRKLGRRRAGHSTSVRYPPRERLFTGMNVWKYQIGARLEIHAPVERVYRIAADPKMVPSYAPEITRIEEVRKFSDHEVLVRSHLKVAWFTLGSLYRYHYRAPTHYCGVQEGRGLLRGYFTLRFRPSPGGTIVIHTEGVRSRLPFLARIVGLIYFHLIERGGAAAELRRLKTLVESSLTAEPVV